MYLVQRFGSNYSILKPFSVISFEFYAILSENSLSVLTVETYPTGVTNKLIFILLIGEIIHCKDYLLFGVKRVCMTTAAVILLHGILN